jgi:hypothetical protein
MDGKHRTFTRLPRLINPRFPFAESSRHRRIDRSVPTLAHTSSPSVRYVFVRRSCLSRSLLLRFCRKQTSCTKTVSFPRTQIKSQGVPNPSNLSHLPHASPSLNSASIVSLRVVRRSSASRRWLGSSVKYRPRTRVRVALAPAISILSITFESRFAKLGRSRTRAPGTPDNLKR